MDRCNDSADLQLSETQMREFGYRVVDLLIEHVTSLPTKTPYSRAGRSDMEALLREDLPSERCADPLHVLLRAQEEIFAHMTHVDHPRFFAFVPGPGNFIGAMADALAAGFNVYAGSWLEAAAPAQVEIVTLDWLISACGLPDGSGGLFTSGGSAANFTALATARHVMLDNEMDGAVAYCSDQTHSSVERSMRLLGFRPRQLQKLPSDEGYRLCPATLQKAVERDRAAGLRPFCVIANAGTTNTGAVDPLPELSVFCNRQHLWLHADGAYGGPAVFCERGRRLLEGIGRVDSLTLDPHKWMFQPFEIGCLLLHDRRHLRDAFHILPEYLEDAVGLPGEVNFSDYGPQLSRGFRALKLWMSLHVFGTEAFARAVEHGFERAEQMATLVVDHRDWQLITPAQMGVLTFRARPAGYGENALDRHNKALVDAILDDGYAMVVSTRLGERTVLRMCTINPRTTRHDIQETFERLERLSQQLVLTPKDQ